MNGANWTVQTGSFAIQSNQLVTTTNGSLMTFNGQTSNSATVDVFHVPRPATTQLCWVSRI